MGSLVGSIAGAVAGPLIGGLMAPKAPKAQQAAGFTPYGVTTGFGTSTFDTKNQTAGYTSDLDTCLLTLALWCVPCSISIHPSGSWQFCILCPRHENLQLLVCSAMVPEKRVRKGRCMWRQRIAR